MTSVLILIGGDPGFQSERQARWLAERLGNDFRVSVARVGVDAGWRRSADAVRRVRDEYRGHVVHAFGSDAATIACLAGSSRVAVTPATPISNKGIGWLRAIQAYRPLEVLCTTATDHRRMVRRGLNPARTHLLRPGVDFGAVVRRRDPALRTSLGFGAEDRVVTLIGESTRESGHDTAMWAGSILNHCDRRYRLLLWGRGDQAARMRRLTGRLGNRPFITIATDVLGTGCTPEQLLPATDIALVAARGPVPTLPIAIAMAAGLPIVATATPEVSELLEDRHTCLMIPQTHPRVLARRVMTLVEDPSLQWRISDMAKTEAFEHFTLTRFLRQHRAVYGQMAGKTPVVIPDEAPGAGLRFHGLA